jgi:hypothetical protein
MAKKVTVICTPADLARFIRQAPEKNVRACLLRIALEATEEESETGVPAGVLTKDKELDSDFINEVCNHLQAYGFWPDNK